MKQLPQFTTRDSLLNYIEENNITVKYDNDILFIDVIDNNIILLSTRLDGSLLTYMMVIGLAMIINGIKSDGREYYQKVYRDMDKVAVRALILRDSDKDQLFKFSNLTKYDLFKHLTKLAKDIERGNYGTNN